MSVYFSGACQDENGNATGGKAGDQTGKEIRTTKAYSHSLGWRVFRHPDIETAKWIAYNAKTIADNNHYGYDQSQRLTGYNAAKSKNWQPQSVTTDCELDCSSMVRTCIACALEKDIPNFNTSTEPNVLLKLGFEEIKNWTLATLRAGDIVCTPSKGHTEIVSHTSVQTTTTTTNDSVKYYKKYTGKKTSFSDALKEYGYDGSYNHRGKIAVANKLINSIAVWSGQPALNTKMFNLYKEGKLIHE